MRLCGFNRDTTRCSVVVCNTLFLIRDTSQVVSHTTKSLEDNLHAKIPFLSLVFGVLPCIDFLRFQPLPSQSLGLLGLRAAELA